ncbi:hypothetical protein BRADI_1g53273v3 [Brachypodium distachyon]|uniref:Uncharacterized protein n=1 Tax=Brachypodium distachyon TaxID=15368 RepID=A0A2K2DR60_BRADI|nr:hypothetical protein BRADI_1g53273v3 [Brachypodium distachyon]
MRSVNDNLHEANAAIHARRRAAAGHELCLGSCISRISAIYELHRDREGRTSISICALLVSLFFFLAMKGDLL